MENSEKVFWLVSAPKTREDTFNALNKRTADENDLATNFKFQVPDLKVGTLDILMSLSDELGKSDTYAELVTRKIANQLNDVLESKSEKAETLTINNSNIDAYLTYFHWDEAKYPPTQSLKTLTETIISQTAKLDEEIKMKSSEYNTLINVLNSEERKAGGNLVLKDISDLVTPNDVVQSEYLETVFIAVPRHAERDFKEKYEKLTDCVVPRSASVVSEDNEYILYRVILFKKYLEDYKNAARERKWVARDYVYDPNKSAKAEKKKMEAEKDKQKKNMIRWCKTNFAEAFIGWVHLKAIRVFVESVLRYGLPINFQAILMLPKKGKSSRLRKVLFDMYGHLGSKNVFSSSAHEDEDVENFFPYVSLDINLDFSRNL